MGSRHSSMKKEVASLQHELRKTSAKHREELAIVVNEKRSLQAKIDELQDVVLQASEEAEKMKVEACVQEERMKALKWELVRQLRLTNSPVSTSPHSSSTRINMEWRLNDNSSLRQSVVSPKKVLASPNEAILPNGTAMCDTSSTRATTNVLSPRQSPLLRPDVTRSALKLSEAKTESKSVGGFTTAVSSPSEKTDPELKQDGDDVGSFSWERQRESDSDSSQHEIDRFSEK